MSRKGRLGRRPFLLPATRNDSPLKGKPETGMLPADTMHSQVPGLCHRVSGSGVRHQVQVQAFLDVSYLCTLLPAPVPAPDDPYLIPDQLRPETRRFATALKGKPETGLYAAVIGPQLIIRSPSAAPFEFRQLHPLPTCQLVNLPAIGVWPTGQLVNRSTRLASHLCTFAQAVGRFAPLHCLSDPLLH